MMTIDIEMDEKQLRELIHSYICDKLGSVNVASTDIVIEVKSRQNYKSEWETAAFRARVHTVNA
jgi:hypothetical protein